MSIITSSGSLYPDKKTLVDQFSLNPTSEDEDKVEANGKLIPINRKIFKDLNRLGSLIINGEAVYKNPAYVQTDQKANYVFKKLTAKFQNSSRLAMNAAKLLQQGLGLDVLEKATFEKGVTTIKEGRVYSTHALSEIKKTNIITTDGKSFKLIHESLVQKTDFDALDSISFFKMKTTVKGSLAALAAENSEQMSIETAYTKEYEKKEEALQDDYTGTFVGGFFNRESYLTQ